jgi:hypothetical protein
MIPVLITFPPSLDSETSRFLVEHYGIESVEKRQALIFSFFVTLWHGFTPIFPLLYGDSLRLIGPRPIVDHFDPQSSSDLKLLPTDPNNLSQVNSDWTLFNSTLAFATAKFAYYYLLPHRDLMIRPLSEGTPAFEQKAVERAYPVFAAGAFALRIYQGTKISTPRNASPSGINRRCALPRKPGYVRLPKPKTIISSGLTHSVTPPSLSYQYLGRRSQNPPPGLGVQYCTACGLFAF